MSTPQPGHETRIALLIDADNSPAAKIEVILAELAKLGVTNVRRAYGNWKKNELKGWEAVLHEYALRPIQQFDHSKGKNATDMLMAIDAMDLLYTDKPDAFGIVSSDADFTPLVMHLRAKGATVYGFGAKKTPQPFVNACSKFLYLETLGQTLEGALDAPAEPAAAPAKTARKRAAGRSPARGKAAAENAADASRGPAAQEALAPPPPVGEDADSAPVGGRQPTQSLKRDARLVSLLRNAVEAAAGEDGWATLGALGTQIANQASFDPRNHGYRKLSDLIEATQLFDIDRRGSSIVVRDKRAARMPRG